MSVTMDQAIAELKDKPLADPESLMKPRGRELVIAEIDRWRARGLRAHVLVVAAGEALDVKALFDKLGYDDKHDLLLEIFGIGFAARGWGQPLTQGHGASRSQRTIADEILGLLRDFGQHAPHAADAPVKPTSTPQLRNPAATTTHDDSSGGGFPVVPVVGGTLAVAAGGLVALAIVRRNKLAAEGLAKLGAAKASAEKVYSDVVLACEDLPGDPQATELQLKAAELKKRIDAVVADTEGAPARGNDPVVLGRLEQLENELAALRSTVLQKARK